MGAQFKKLLTAAAIGPVDTAEIFMTHNELLGFRGKPHRKIITTIGSHLTDSIPSLIETPFSIILTLPEFALQIAALSLPNEVVSIIATTEDINGTYNLSKLKNLLSAQIFDYEIYRSIKRARSSNNIKSKMPKMRAAYSEVAGCTFYGSGSTVANELVLVSLGYRASKQEYINPLEIENFFRAISESAESILCSTDKHREEGGEVILYSPAIIGFMYNMNSNSWNQLLRGIKRPLHKDFIRAGLIRNPGYSGYTAKDGATKDDHPYKDPAVAYIVTERQKELMATNFSVGLLASSLSIPALRLPNSINLQHSKLTEIERTQKRSDLKSEKQLQLKFKELSVELESAFCERFRHIILTKTKSCIICSDTPLEWTYLGDLPLMISHEVSRIPMTPGNMLLQFACMGAPFNIQATAVRDILVIRSFKSGDKLYPLLEDAIKSFPLTNETSVRFVDVTNIEEVISTLNGFSGAMVIFDCHGEHGGPEGTGWLAIGDEKLNSWELHGIARVPPIVALSACSTSAIAGSYVSVANGFMRSGALSVMGTFLPVDGRLASAFFARIVWRIDLFLTALKSMGYQALSWRLFTSNFLKMSYSTDVLMHFRNSCLISRSDYEEIHINVNLKINSLSDDWFDYLIDKVSLKSGVPAASLRLDIKNNTPLLETMLYCQLGRPDMINIVL